MSKKSQELNNKAELVNNNQCEFSQQVDLATVLAARDQRSAARKKIFTQSETLLISVSLLMPGAVKRTLLSRSFLKEYVMYLRRELQGQGFFISEEKALAHPGGDSYLFYINDDSDVLALKRFLIAAEEEYAWARVVDLDLYVDADTQITRQDLSYPERKCLICSQTARICSRSRKHELSLLEDKVEHFQKEGLQTLLSQRYQTAAANAALDELLVFPKAGLVTGINSGSHSDMDRFTYAASNAAILPYYRKICLESLDFAFNRLSEDEIYGQVNINYEHVLTTLRLLGQRTERQMFARTNNINTQKGYIYLSGLVLFTATIFQIKANLQNFLIDSNEKAMDKHAKLIQSWSEEIANLATQLEDIAPHRYQEKTVSTGVLIADSYGIRGVRGEACSGLETVFNISWPFYKILRQKRINKNNAGVITLLILIALTEDTTLIKRAGINKAAQIRIALAQFFSALTKSEQVLNKLPTLSDLEGFVNSRKIKHCDSKNKPFLSLTKLQKVIFSTEFLGLVSKKETELMHWALLWSKYFSLNNYSAGGAADLLAITFLVDNILRECTDF